MDDRTDTQRMDDGTDDGTHGFREASFLIPTSFPLLYRIICSRLRLVVVGISYGNIRKEIEGKFNNSWNGAHRKMSSE